MKKMFILFTMILVIFSLYSIFSDKIQNNYKGNFNKKMEINYKIEKQKLKDLKNNCATTAIIGSGPAGCSAALYCSRMGGITTVISGDEPGGQLMTTSIVENWPGLLNLEGPMIMQLSKNQAEKYGAIFIEDNVTSIDSSTWPFKLTLKSGNILYAFSIILSTGSTHKNLNCVGEKEYWSKGVSSCAICDGPIYKNKDVIVVGGGDSACEEALQLVPHVKSIKLLVRSNKMRASTIMKKRIEDYKKIEILYNTNIKEIKGDNKKVNQVILLNNENKKEFNLEVSAVFIAIGHIPNTNLLKDIVEIDENGLIVCKYPSQETSIEGIYAAGDVSNNYRQAGIASGEGIKAALDAYNFLQNKEIEENFIKNNSEIWITKKNVEKELTKRIEDQIVCENGSCYLVQPIENINDKKIEKIANKKIEKIANKKIEKEIIKEKKVKTEIIDIKTMKDLKKIGKELKNQFWLLDLYTTQCPSCKTLKLTLNDYILDNNSISVYTMNVENTIDALDYFDVNAVPVIILMNGENEVNRTVGSIDKK
jgi:thioredoxin reductase (NADPH)